MSFRCIICSGSVSKTLSEKTRDSRQKIFKCGTCCHVQLFPLPNESSEKEFYDKDKQTKLIRKHFNLDEFEESATFDNKRRVHLLISKIKKNKSILDVGCGYGFFIKELKKMGLKASGVEISKERRSIARKMSNENIFNFRIDGKRRIHKKFDVVTLFHVLEHVKDPINFLTDLRMYLNNNGRLLIEVPNLNFYLMSLSDAYKDFFWQSAHISYFTPKILVDVLNEAGYKNIKVSGVQRYSFTNALYWIARGKPQLNKPSYESRLPFDKLYKKIVTELNLSDTLWIEAVV